MTELVTSEDGSPVGDVEEGLGDERGLVIHHPAEEQPYRCPLCSQTFSQQPSLVRHQKAHAGAGRTATFVCPECGSCCLEQNVRVESVLERAACHNSSGPTSALKTSCFWHQLSGVLGKSSHFMSQSAHL